MAKSIGRKPVNRDVLRASFGSDESVNRVIVVLFIVCILITGISVRFLDSVHYNSQITKLNNQNTALQNTVATQQNDIKFLIDANQTNCFQLQSIYAKSICKAPTQTD